MTWLSPRIVASRFDIADIEFVRRGFALEPAEWRVHLETRAGAFIEGAQAFARQPDDAIDAVNDVEADLRGFAYEGAAMAACLLDALEIGRHRRMSALLSGETGHQYRHLIHVGAGWGLARLRVPVPWVTRSLDPLLRGLILDGAGFQEMFFRPTSTMSSWTRKAKPTGRDLVRATGHGRALWFVCTADISRIREIIHRAPEPVRPALWAGAGLAVAYANRPGGVGGVDLVTAAGAHVAHLGQGLVFGAAARAAHGFIPDATQDVVSSVLGIDAVTAARWADQAAERVREDTSGIAAYQTWRRLVREQCQALHSGRTTL